VNLVEAEINQHEERTDKDSQPPNSTNLPSGWNAHALPHLGLRSSRRIPITIPAIPNTMTTGMANIASAATEDTKGGASGTSPGAPGTNSIVDCGTSNLGSMQNMLNFGAKSKIAASAHDLEGATKIIVPGVGFV
jgi:hypothetical protein